MQEEDGRYAWDDFSCIVALRCRYIVVKLHWPHRRIDLDRMRHSGPQGVVDLASKAARG